MRWILLMTPRFPGKKLPRSEGNKHSLKMNEDCHPGLRAMCCLSAFLLHLTAFEASIIPFH